MANTAAYFGFMQDSGTGSTPTYEQVSRIIAYNAAAIYAGDPVTSQTDGTIAVSAPGTTQIAGVFGGCEYLSVSQKRKIWNNYWPGSDVASTQTVTGYIVNDPNAQFLAQSGATGLTLADVGSNAQFAIGTGNALTGQSGAYINTVAVTATHPFRILGLVTSPVLGIAAPESGAYAYAYVGFNNVDTKSLTGI